jgi:hypothetical protein
VSCCDPASLGVVRLTAGGGRLSGVNVADNDHVDVHLLFTAVIVSMLFIGVLWRGSRLEAGWLTHPMMAVVCCLV